MSEERKYSDEVKDRYNRIVDVLSDIPMDKITVLTGNNGSGKSLIRKQIAFRLKEHLKLDHVKDAMKLIKSVSMQTRTESRPEFGALSSMMHDSAWLATSQNTYHLLNSMFKSIYDKNNSNTRYIVIDEFEIGCGEETVLALVNYINEKIKNLPNTNVIGVLIITHSRIGVEKLKYDEFFNIEGLTKDEWLNRELTPTDLNKLDENELFFLY